MGHGAGPRRALRVCDISSIPDRRIRSLSPAGRNRNLGSNRNLGNRKPATPAAVQGSTHFLWSGLPVTLAQPHL